MLHLGLELEIDRKTDINMNFSIFKLLIEDVQQDVKIAPQFRVST